MPGLNFIIDSPSIVDQKLCKLWILPKESRGPNEVPKCVAGSALGVDVERRVRASGSTGSNMRGVRRGRRAADTAWLLANHVDQPFVYVPCVFRLHALHSTTRYGYHG